MSLLMRYNYIYDTYIFHMYNNYGVYTYVCNYIIAMYVCMYVYMYVCMYVCMYACKVCIAPLCV